MTDVWKEFENRVDRWRTTGDTERLRMSERFHESFRHRETAPDVMLALLTQSRDDARRLNEPW